MRTITKTLYKFDELSSDAQDNAISNFRDRDRDYSDYYYEIRDSVNAVCDLFNLKTGRQYDDIRTSHIDEDILQMSGVRLYKYLMNNYGDTLFKPLYIKSVDRVVNWRPFYCKVGKGVNGEYTQIYSRIRKDDSCVLTGVCYDNYIMQPVYDFLKHPDKGTTWEDVIKDIEHAIGKCYSDTEEWTNSDEFIKDEIEANEYEFDENGNIA